MTDFPYAYRLRRPLYSYSDDGTQTHADKYRGLLEFGPIKATKVIQPECLFLFQEGDRDHANRLYLSLRNGIAQFPGCKKLVGLTLERESVEPLRVAEQEEAYLAKAFTRSVEERLANGRRPDFAFILYSKQPSPQNPDPYDAAKAAFTAHGIPSQYVSWELLNSDQQFRFAISNIALSFFVKLGGIPWSVSVRRNPSVILGVGHAETRSSSGKSVRKLTGFATCVLSNGVYLDTTFFPPVDNYDDFLTHLQTGLKGVIDQMLSRVERVEKVTIHISHEERNDVVETVRNLLDGYEPIQHTPILFELVRLTADSDFSVFDLSNPDRVSEEGVVVALGQERALLVTEGRKEKAVWRGRKPVALEMRRQFSSSRSMNFKETIEDAFYLSSVNWRGFNAITQPISLLYAVLLAQQLAKMADADPNIVAQLSEHSELNSVPWFI